VLALAGCGGDDSSPQLVDGSQPPELPVELADLDDPVLTRTTVVPARDVPKTRLQACGFQPESDDTSVVMRVGLHGSSYTFSGRGGSLYACDAVPDPSTAAEPDEPYDGIWCGGAAGFLDDGRLNDPRLDVCTNTESDLTAFAWVEPLQGTAWLVVSDAGSREVYEVAESFPVRVTTTDGTTLEGASALFPIEEYFADGTKQREYTLRAQVAG
jgi:hypothetical protein